MPARPFFSVYTRCLGVLSVNIERIIALVKEVPHLSFHGAKLLYNLAADRANEGNFNVIEKHSYRFTTENNQIDTLTEHLSSTLICIIWVYSPDVCVHSSLNTFYIGLVSLPKALDEDMATVASRRLLYCSLLAI